MSAGMSIYTEHVLTVDTYFIVLVDTNISRAPIIGIIGDRYTDRET